MNNVRVASQLVNLAEKLMGKWGRRVAVDIQDGRKWQPGPDPLGNEKRQQIAAVFEEGVNRMFQEWKKLMNDDVEEFSEWLAHYIGADL